jgi:hypothetical protein
VDTGLAGPAEVLYKADARSRVWGVRAGGQWYVVKRFEYAPPRQLAALGLGLHPAQLEWRGHQRLRRAGIAAVPVMARGMSWTPTGCRVWLATPWAGRPLHELLKDPALSQQCKSSVVDRTAMLSTDFLAAGLWFRDFKPSNVIVSDADRPQLIDAGSVRRRWRGRRVEQMLSTMQRVMQRNGVPPDLIERFEQQGRACREAKGGASP